MEFFRVNQRAIQLYDIDHARASGDAYRQHQMGLDDWDINAQSVAVLQPIADWNQHMQGTKSYPTLPLVLPTVYTLIAGMADDAPLEFSFRGQLPYELEPSELHPSVRQARSAMYADWISRWVTNLDMASKRIYAIATLLHPGFKSYDFVDHLNFVPSSDKTWALRELRTEWEFQWKRMNSADDQSAATPEQTANAEGVASAIAPGAAPDAAVDTPAGNGSYGTEATTTASCTDSGPQ